LYNTLSQQLETMYKYKCISYMYQYIIMYLHVAYMLLWARPREIQGHCCQTQLNDITEITTCQILSKEVFFFVKGIVQWSFYVYINFGILHVPLCTVPWNDISCMSVVWYKCQVYLAKWWKNGVYRYWFWVSLTCLTTFL